MDKLLIRLAHAADRTELAALQWRASLSNPADRDALLADPGAVDLPAAQIEAGGVFVAERHGTAQGFATLLRREDGDAELDALFVEPDNWGRGIGRALVDHCAITAREIGAEVLHVIGNPHAEGFYLACGFTLRDTVPTRFGVGLLMTRRLGG